MPRGPLYCTALSSHDTVRPTGVTGRHVYANAFDDPSCYIDLFCEESVSGCLFIYFFCASTVNFQWRQPRAAVTAWVRDADWLQAVEERRGEERRVTGYSMVCCDVSSLLQHGAHELKKTLGHYILLSGIYTVQWTRQFGLGYQRTRLCIPNCFLRFSSNSFQLRLPLVVESGSSVRSEYHIGSCVHAPSAPIPVSE